MTTTTTDTPDQAPVTALDEIVAEVRPMVFRMLGQGNILGAWAVLVSYAEAAGHAWRTDHDNAHPGVPQTLGHVLAVTAR